MSVRSVYWDAATFHALFAKESGRVEACEHMVKEAKDGLLFVYTSAVTYTECMRIRGKPALDPQNEGVIAAFFMHRWIRIVNCDRNIGENARLLCWQHSTLHPKDAIHIASALFVPLEVVYTYDDALLKLNGKVGGPLFRIEKPPTPPPPPAPPPQTELGLSTSPKLGHYQDE